MGINRQHRKKTWDFVGDSESSLGLRVQEDAGEVTLELGSGGEGGALITVLAAGSVFPAVAALDLNGGGIPPADLLRFEALLKLDSIDTNTDIRLGVANGYNADPDLIGESAWFKFDGTGASNAHKVYVETDDGTNEVNNDDTTKQLSFTDWMRFSIDFATGIKTVSSPPGGTASSGGGLTTLRFGMARLSGDVPFHDPVSTSAHMDISAASGPLGPILLVRQATAAPAADIKIYCKEMSLEYLV